MQEDATIQHFEYTKFHKQFYVTILHIVTSYLYNLTDCSVNWMSEMFAWRLYNHNFFYVLALQCSIITQEETIKHLQIFSQMYKPLNTFLFLAEHSGKQWWMGTGPAVQLLQTCWQVLLKTRRSDSVAAYIVLPWYRAAYWWHY